MNDTCTETGRITTWTDRGFGFIAPDRGGVNIFVHVTGFDELARPQVGDRVEYLVTPGRDDRPLASSVRTIERVEATPV